MNKMIIILVVGLLLIPVSAIAEIHGSIEVGRDTDRPEAYAKVDLDYSFPIWMLITHIYGGWETWVRVNQNGLNPTMMYDKYLIGLKIDIGDIYINVHHWCSHPLWTDPPYRTNTDVELHRSRTVISTGIKW